MATNADILAKECTFYRSVLETAVITSSRSHSQVYGYKWYECYRYALTPRLENRSEGYKEHFDLENELMVAALDLWLTSRQSYVFRLDKSQLLPVTLKNIDDKEQGNLGILCTISNADQTVWINSTQFPRVTQFLLDCRRVQLLRDAVDKILGASLPRELVDQVADDVLQSCGVPHSPALLRKTWAPRSIRDILVAGDFSPCESKFSAELGRSEQGVGMFVLAGHLEESWGLDVETIDADVALR